MVSACFSPVNGSLAAATSASSLQEPRLCRVSLSQAPRSLQSLRPLELRMLSLSVSRVGLYKSGFSVVGHARAELSVEDVEALDAPSDVSDESEDDAPSSPPFADNSAFKLYVGNLPWSCNSEELAGVFQKAGSVDMVEIAMGFGTKCNFLWLHK